MTQQLFEAASGIGAMLEEAEVANSRRDMAAKQAIALGSVRNSVCEAVLIVAAVAAG
jgi:hypothetical protein